MENFIRALNKTAIIAKEANYTEKLKQAMKDWLNDSYESYIKSYEINQGRALFIYDMHNNVSYAVCVEILYEYMTNQPLYSINDFYRFYYTIKDVNTPKPYKSLKYNIPKDIMPEVTEHPWDLFDGKLL